MRPEHGRFGHPTNTLTPTHPPPHTHTPAPHLLHVCVVELDDGQPQVRVGAARVELQHAAERGGGARQVTQLEAARADAKPQLGGAARVLLQCAAVAAQKADEEGGGLLRQQVCGAARVLLQREAVAARKLRLATRMSL
eukprot:360508-Chlamydomonas_euryale.AAC.10